MDENNTLSEAVQTTYGKNEYSLVQETKNEEREQIVSETHTDVYQPKAATEHDDHFRNVSSKLQKIEQSRKVPFLISLLKGKHQNL